MKRTLIFTQNKKLCRKLYLKNVLNIIKIKPDIAMPNFEKAERKALKIVFPQAKIIIVILKVL